MVSLSNREESFPGGDGDIGSGGEAVVASHGQGLAETLIADYTLPTRAWLPSAAVVALLSEFGVASGAARTIISRMARRGVLEGSRQGRYSSYRLTGEAAAGLWSGGGLIAAFTTTRRVGRMVDTDRLLRSRAGQHATARATDGPAGLGIRPGVRRGLGLALSHDPGGAG